MLNIKSVGELKLYFARSWTYLQTGYDKYCMNMTISFQSSSYLEPLISINLSYNKISSGLT